MGLCSLYPMPTTPTRPGAALLATIVAIAGVSAANPSCAEGLASALNGSGFAVLRQAFSPAQAVQAVAALSRPGGLLVRDAIWMRHTERIAQVLELDKVFGELLELPAEVEASLTEILGADWLIGSYHALVLHPEPAPMNASERDRVLADHLHSDYPYGHATTFHGGSARARAAQWPHTMQLLWMLSDFTEANGATLVLPSSHTDGAIPQRHRGAHYARFRAGAVPVTGRAGDILVYYGQLWHSVGLNHAAAPRAALIGQFLPFYMAPMEAHARTLPMRVQRALTPRAARALGLNWHHFFSSLGRLAPLPRGPIGGAHFLFDALWEGYRSPHHPETIRQTLTLLDLPPAIVPLALSLAPLWLQLHRWLVLGAHLRSIDPPARSSCVRPSPATSEIHSLARGSPLDPREESLVEWHSLKRGCGDALLCQPNVAGLTTLTTQALCSAAPPPCMRTRVAVAA